MSITSVKYNKDQDGSNISVSIIYENGEKWLKTTYNFVLNNNCV